jgi:hypothetical protein
MPEGAALTSIVCLVVFCVILAISILWLTKVARGKSNADDGKEWILPGFICFIGVVGTIVSAISVSNDTAAVAAKAKEAKEATEAKEAKEAKEAAGTASATVVAAKKADKKGT